jgi:hypothetical protein
MNAELMPADYFDTRAQLAQILLDMPMGPISQAALMLALNRAYQLGKKSTKKWAQAPQEFSHDLDPNSVPF